MSSASGRKTGFSDKCLQSQLFGKLPVEASDSELPITPFFMHYDVDLGFSFGWLLPVCRQSAQDSQLTSISPDERIALDAPAERQFSGAVYRGRYVARLLDVNSWTRVDIRPKQCHA
jgi:hypothetical protein